MSSTASNTQTRFPTPLGSLASRSVSRKRMRRGAAAQKSSQQPSLNEAPNGALVTQHLGQVRIIAKKIRARLPAHVELDDLIGYGTVGLMNAVEGFDPARGTLLKTYAEHRIRGAILDGLRGMNWLSRSACRRKTQLQRISDEAADVAAVQGKPEPPAAAPPMSAAGPAPDRRGAVHSPAALGPTLLEIVCGGWFLEELEQISERTGWRQQAGMGSSIEDPETIYLHKELAQHVGHAVARLPGRERTLVEMRYQREMSMIEISQILGVHPSRVSQLHAQAMGRLKRWLSAAVSPLDGPVAAEPCQAIAV
jgi:RNA polymerase sigma factor for flagellar operon FliA